MFGLFKKNEVEGNKICEFNRFIYNFLEIGREYKHDETIAKIDSLILNDTSGQVHYTYYNSMGSGSISKSLKEFYDYYIVDINTYLQKQINSLQTQVNEHDKEIFKKDKDEIELATISKDAVNELRYKITALEIQQKAIMEK